MLTKLKKDQQYIYILLSRTHTMPAKIIRLFTGEPYSHASIALDLELNQLYSFARRNINNPFDSGFVYEDIETGIFGKDKNVYCSVYAIPVSEKQYQKLCKELNLFIQNKEDYDYNFLGLVGTLIGKNIQREHHYFCSQFVSHLLSQSGIELFRKEHGLIRPYDFHNRLKDARIYSGKLSEYRGFVKVQQYKRNLLEKLA